MSCVKKSKHSKSEGKKLAVQFGDPREDAKRDEDCKMEAGGEADSCKKLEIREKRK